MSKLISIDKDSSHYRDGYRNGLDGYTDEAKAVKFAKDEANEEEINIAEYWSGALAGILKRKENEIR